MASQTATIKFHITRRICEMNSFFLLILPSSHDNSRMQKELWKTCIKCDLTDVKELIIQHEAHLLSHIYQEKTIAPTMEAEILC